MGRPADGGFRPDAGTLELSGEGERLSLAWILFLRELLHREGGFVVRAPGLMAAGVLERSGYAEHFPQNVLRAVPLTAPATPGLALSPACCLHVYEQRAGTVLREGGVHGVVYGPCARYEGGRWSDARLSHFTMLEWVALGSAEWVAELAGTVPAVVSGAFEALDLPFDLAEATDPFFQGERSGPALMQRMTGAKHEWRGPSGTAVASINRHADTYGTRFEIRADGSPAHSMCVAFGIERLVREGLEAWGTAPEGWPAELREHGTLL